MYLYLVRHGQSEGNVAKTFHGHIDYPLTPLGREQARAGRGEAESGLLFPLCGQRPVPGLGHGPGLCGGPGGSSPSAVPACGSSSWGDAEGLTWEEMGQRFPGIREMYISDWSHTTPPAASLRRRWPGGWVPVWMTSSGGGRILWWWPITDLCRWHWPILECWARRSCSGRSGSFARGAIPPLKLWTEKVLCQGSTCDGTGKRPRGGRRSGPRL